MRILDLFKGKPQKTLVLDESAPSQWPQLLMDYRGLDQDFKQFADKVHELQETIEKSIRKFTDEHVLAAIPDRSRTMNALHGNEYATQVRKLLAAATFADLFGFEKQQAAYFEANSSFKDASAKNANVLKEFLHDELKITTYYLQQLEDTIINFTKTLEEKGYPQIRKIQELNLKVQQLGELQEKYEKLLTSLKADKKRTQEKRQKLEDEIKEQRVLVRNEASLQALEKIRKIDEELFKIAAQYTSLCQDVLGIYKKNAHLELPAHMRKILEGVPKDPLAFISANAEVMKQTFDAVLAQFEEERPGNTRTVIERLSQLSQAVEQDARKIQTSAPDERALKKEMMRDIAALNMYDKTQFLMRAQAEEEAINHKLEFLQAELDPTKRQQLEDETKALARSFGALLLPRKTS